MVTGMLVGAAIAIIGLFIGLFLGAAIAIGSRPNKTEGIDIP